ncbi:MAG TPA: hypothetical protein VHB21_17885, partial [Minicystis sp.]|nr:hypothetical protein [Minicystis sp.]
MPAVGACPSIQAHLEELTLGDGQEHLTQPSLVAVSDTPPSVAVVYGANPETPVSAARVAAFDGWGAWPPPTPASVAVKHTPGGDAIAGDALLATTHAPVAGRDFALLFERTGAQHAYTAYEAGVSIEGVPNVDGALINAAPGTPRAFVASSDLLG